MISARVAPCFVQVFDPVTNNQSSPLVSVAMSTNENVPGSVWINHHAGSEGGGISRSIDRQFLILEGYVGNILSATAAKPSTDPTVERGIVTLDAFTNAISVYSSLSSWFGIPVGAPSSTQDNPTGIASMDGTNFWGTGNFAGTSEELDGTLFYNPNVGSQPFEVQNYVQAAAEVRIIGGTLYAVLKGSSPGQAAGVYNFVNPETGAVVPLPYDPNVANPYNPPEPAFTNLVINWGLTYQNIANFDMDPAGTVAYGADQTYGIVKFTNNAGTWVQAPYYFGTTNLGTTAQTSGNQGCFGICVDFSGTNPVIYATTMENGYPTPNTAAGHQNQNRIIKIVDTGVNPGTNMVAQTLAIAATTNEFFGGIDFTPDLSPLITTNPVDYGTIVGGSATFNIGVQSVYALSYQWLQNGTNLVSQTNASLTLNSLDTTYNNDVYQCVVTNNYGSVTSAPAVLSVTVNPVAPQITSGTNNILGYVGNNVTFAAISATGTQPFTSYQWFNPAGQPLVDDGVKYSGSATASLSISNLQTTDSGNYYVAVGNAAGFSATNVADVLAVEYHLATINAGEPASATTFVGVPVSLTADETGATPPVTNQWYRNNVALTDTGDFSGSATPTLTITPSATSDSSTNYYIVVSNGGGSVTSSPAVVSVIVAPALSSVSYSNQVYKQTFDSLPDPGSAGVSKSTGLATGNGTSVNSFNNPKDSGSLNGVAYSLANPFDFNYPVIGNSYVGGLALSALSGWYGAADTNTAADGVDGITRFGAQDGDQSTGGVIDFGLDDQEGGIAGTNRSLGLISTGTTGSTAFGLKLINKSTNTLNYINVSFLGEYWRNNSGSRTMSFAYAVDPTANSFVLGSQPEATNTAPQLIPGTVNVTNLAFSFPYLPLAAVNLDGTQASNQVSMVSSNLMLSTPWTPNAALWLIWSINYYGAGSGQGYSIDNLNFSATVNPVYPVITPINITPGSAQLVSTGIGASKAITFSFTNATGLSFSVLGTNNIAAPKATWPVVGTAVENPAGSGQYQFTDPSPDTNTTRFYLLRQP